tara:strand:+ start:747 stop:1139 length:393 start_codon:yes stop_codon:yes gene_type:complete
MSCGGDVPTVVKINGVNVDVHFVENDEELAKIIPGEKMGNAMGYAVTYPKLMVIVDKVVLEQSHELPRMTLLHELIHIISDLNGLGLTERQVLGLETGLFGLFMDNKEFREFMFMSKKKKPTKRPPKKGY